MQLKILSVFWLLNQAKLKISNQADRPEIWDFLQLIAVDFFGSFSRAKLEMDFRTRSEMWIKQILNFC